MNLREAGQSLLIVAFLFAAVGVVEPTGWVNAIIASLLVVGFSVWLHTSDRDWFDGYNEAAADYEHDLFSDAVSAKCCKGSDDNPPWHAEPL